MQAALEQVRTNLVRVRNLGSIVDALDSQTTAVLDLSDILRAELVLAVSALDQFVHEVVRLGMLDAYEGRRLRTNAFLRFQVSLEGAQVSLEGAQVSLEGALRGIDSNNAGNSYWLDDQIRTRNAYRSFQSPDNIADAVRLVSEVQLWNEVAKRMGTPSDEVRNRLRLIVDRRNQIAHEADVNPSPYEELWPIDRQIVTESVDFIERVVESMYSVIA